MEFSVLPTDEREEYYIMEDVIQEEQSPAEITVSDPDCCLCCQQSTML